MPIRTWHLIPACLTLAALLGGGFAVGSAVGASPGQATTRLFVRTVRVRAPLSTVTSVRPGPTTTVRAAPRSAGLGLAAARLRRVQPATTVTAPGSTLTQLVTGTAPTVTTTQVVTQTSVTTTTESVPTTVTVTVTETHGHH